ncbi:hypothetical protein EVAR_52758_1 [Eumeta japonica]|uniref:Uncharacterized protein n=1 Tax=Eumeta variegata TaxID=151549 RepID=A0A4C1XDT9_EUMVA|nr:hypothetical protein EVAR_52758_1 [Eumeta japonica]
MRAPARGRATARRASSWRFADSRAVRRYMGHKHIRRSSRRTVGSRHAAGETPPAQAARSRAELAAPDRLRPRSGPNHARPTSARTGLIFGVAKDFTALIVQDTEPREIFLGFRTSAEQKKQN